VWPKEDGSPTPAYRLLDLYFTDYDTASAAVSVFPGQQYQAPRSWGERAFGNLIYWDEVDKGGHLAAWEQPEIFADKLRAAFKPLR
jgi:hypothetical protein